MSLFRKTVDSAVQRLKQVLVDLDIVIEQRAAEVTAGEERLQALVAQINDAEDEIIRARRVKSRLEELLS